MLNPDTYMGILVTGASKEEAIENYKIVATGEKFVTVVQENEEFSFLTNASNLTPLNPITGDMDLEEKQISAEAFNFISVSSGEEVGVDVNYTVCTSGCGSHIISDTEELLDYCPVCSTSLSMEEDFDDEMEDDFDEEDDKEMEDDFDEEMDDTEEDDEEMDDTEEDDEEDDEEMDDTEEDDEEMDDTEEDDEEDEESLSKYLEEDGKENKMEDEVSLSKYLSDMKEHNKSLSKYLEETIEDGKENKMEDEDEDGKENKMEDEDEDDKEDNMEEEKNEKEVKDKDESKTINISDELLEASVDMLTIASNGEEVDFKRVKLLNVGNVDGMDTCIAMYNTIPIATANNETAGKFHNIFGTETYFKAATASMSENGIRRGLSDMGFKMLETTISIPKYVENTLAEQKQAIEEKVTASANDSIKEREERLLAAMSTAAIGINRNFFSGIINPVKEELIRTLSSVGVKQPEVIVDSAFSKHGDEYHKVLLDKTMEITASSLDLQNELAKAVASSNYMKTEVSNMEERLSSLGKSEEVKEEVSVSTAKASTDVDKINRILATLRS